MATTELVGGRVSLNVLATATWFFSFAGPPAALAVEARANLQARASYTLANLLIRVITSTTTGDATWTSRKNGAAGGMSVTIGAGLTGAFQDTTNTDALVDGDLFTSRVVAPAVGNHAVTLVGATLNGSGGDHTILACGTINQTGEAGNTGGTTDYVAIGGRTSQATIEANTQYTLRVATTLSNLRMFVSNAPDTAITVRPRKNGANGNQSLSIAIGGTGAFEDTTNTDAVVDGDEVNYSLDSGADGGFFYSALQMKSASGIRQMILSGELGISADVYLPPEGLNTSTVTESQVQMVARSAFTARHLFAYVSGHGASSGVNLYIRVNGANSALTVNVPDSTTGIFEDTTNSVSVVSLDTYNFFADHGGGAGTITTQLLGFGGGAAAASGRSRVVMVG